MKTAGRLTNACSQYGAEFGRASDLIPAVTRGIRPTLRRVPLSDPDCYDSGGAYWGGPSNLYRVTWEERKWEGTVGNLRIIPVLRQYFFRAQSEQSARCRVKELFPSAHFPSLNE